MDYLKLKSGTDVRGVAVEGVENEHIQLTNEVITTITNAFVVWFCQKQNVAANSVKIAVGHDSRISAARIKKAVTDALVSVGVCVVDCSLASTPSMFMTTVKLGCDAAIQITASHHPFNRNGLKFFTRQGGIEGSELSEILTFANQNKKEKTAAGCVETVDFMSEYAKILRNLVIEKTGSQKPLEGFKIIVDAGNGAGGFYAYDVLKPLGANIEGSQFLEPDGMFPNHIPNPEDKTAMASVSAATINAKADLGVIFDTDVDRASCVDSHGNEINRNKIVALASAIALDGEKGGTIVTDSVTSSGLKTFIESDLGGHHYRYKRGYKNVIDEAIRLNKQGINTPLAIETSGHAAFRENYFLDDGAYLITKIIIKAALLKKQGKTIENLIGTLAVPAEEKEVRFKILCDDFRTYGESVIEKLEAFSNEKGFKIADDNREGIRVFVDDGWFLLRLSVHDPIMPLNIESDSVSGVAKIISKIKPFFESCNNLDISVLQ